MTWRYRNYDVGDTSTNLQGDTNKWRDLPQQVGMRHQKEH